MRFMLIIFVALSIGTIGCKNERHSGSSQNAHQKKGESSYDILAKNSPDSKVYLSDYIKTVESKMADSAARNHHGDGDVVNNKAQTQAPSKANDINWEKFYGTRINQTANSNGRSYDYEFEPATSLSECRLSTRTVSL